MTRAAAVFLAAIFLMVFAFAVHYTYIELFAPNSMAEAVSTAPPLSIREAETAIVSAAEAVMPAVVSVETKHRVASHPFSNDPFFRQFFPDDFFDRGAEGEGLASGFLVDSRGYVLTNNHVVKDADEITVRLEDGRDFKAKVMGADARLDVAVLKISDGVPFPTVPLGNSDDLKVGMFVLAIGTPFNRNLSQTVTMGIVSALSRSGFGLEDLENFIQTDAAINQGNSGGPLVNLRGEVVGINVAIATAGGGSAGIGFAIPINSANHSFQSIVSLGRVVHGFLGVNIQNIDDELRQSLGLETNRGALVSQIVEGGPADKAGLRRGDVIIEWNGQRVRTASSLTDAVSQTNVGEKARVKFIRDGKEQTVEVVVAERPADARDVPAEEAAPSSLEKLGITVKWVEKESRKGQETEGGLTVVSVERGSVAAERGFRPGMIILEVDGAEMTSVDKLTETIAEPGRYRFLVRYRGNNYYIAVTL